MVIRFNIAVGGYMGIKGAIEGDWLRVIKVIYGELVSQERKPIDLCAVQFCRVIGHGVSDNYSGVCKL